jgi:hypothetical protein
MPTEE